MNSLEELEREIIQPLQRQMAEQTQPRPPRKDFFWSVFFTSLGAFFMGVALTGLVLFQNQMLGSWREATTKFQWLVFVEGEQLAVDEVGRFLGKIDGVADVAYVSPDDTLATLQNDSTLSSDLALLGSNPFPVCWRVRWKPEAFNSSKMDDALHDVNVFPGVVSVASDPKTLEDIRLFKRHSQRVTFILSILWVTLSVFLTALLARLFFYSWRRRSDGKRQLATGLFSLVSILAGGGLIFFLW